MSTITPQIKRSLPWTPRLLKQQALTLLASGMIAVSLSPSQLQAASPDNPWTQFVPSVDTRLIFVSSSTGSDTNSGLTPERPVKTLEQAYELLRDGYPDWMLLKRGDTWHESLPAAEKSGRAENELMVIGAYGSDTERPKIITASDGTALKAMGAETLSHVAYVGLHLEPETRAANDSPSGIRWLRACDNILFEDMYIEGYSGNVVLQAYPESNRLDNIRFNGCVIVDAWSNTGHSQGMYAKGVNGLEVENSVLASNGFNHDMGAEPTIFNHNAYIQNGCTEVVFRNNIIADASSHGIQLRPGGIVENNLFISNPLALLVGGGSYPEEGGVTATVHNNLVMYGRDISPDLPRGFGFTTSNIRDAEFTNNYFNISSIGPNRDAICIGGDRDLMVSNLTIENNMILNWEGSINIKEPEDGQVMNNIRITQNSIYRDLTPNSNGNLNKPFIRTYNDSDQDIFVSGNEYNYFQMHDRPFRVGNSMLSLDEWMTTMEPAATTVAMNDSPPTLGLDEYLSSIEQNGDMQDFLERARLMSRSNPQHNYSPSRVINWFTSEAAANNVRLVE